MFRLLCVCLLAVIIASCGNKGALYLPDDSTQMQKESSL